MFVVYLRTSRFSQILIFNIKKSGGKKKIFMDFFLFASVSGENLSPSEEEKCPCKLSPSWLEVDFRHTFWMTALSLTGAKEEGKRARGEESAGERKHEEGCLAWLWPLSLHTRTGLLTRGKAPGSSTLLGSCLDPPLNNSLSIFFHWERQGVSLVPSIQKTCVCGQAKGR